MVWINTTTILCVGSDAILNTAMTSAWDKQEPIVAYYWEPMAAQMALTLYCQRMNHMIQQRIKTEWRLPSGDSYGSRKQ